MPRKTKTLKPFGGYQPTESESPITPPPAVRPTYRPKKEMEEGLAIIRETLSTLEDAIRQQTRVLENLEVSLKEIAEKMEEKPK